MTKESVLQVNRLHHQACHFRKATSQDQLRKSASYHKATSLGWHLYPPVDIDILWKGNGKFEYRFIDPEDYTRYRPQTQEDQSTNRSFLWGEAGSDIVQIWSGLSFKTPPGWCLHLGNPANCVHQGRLAVHGQPFTISENILETDLIQFDLWIEVKFIIKNKWVFLRKKSFPPLAQLIPINRESFENSWITN